MFSKYKIAIICLFLLPFMAKAQQDPMFSRNMFNSLYLLNNPAYSGVHEYWTTNLVGRAQWLSLDGAPRTIYGGAEGTIADGRANIGFGIVHDRITADRSTDVSGNYAYRFQMGAGKLALGIRLGATFYSTDFSSINAIDPSDPLYVNDVRGIVPRAGLGLYYHTEKWFVGLSVPTLVALDKRTTFNINLDKTGIYKRHYYSYLGYVFALKNEITLRPTVFLKYEPEAPLQADFGLMVWARDLIGFGVSYRTKDAVSVMVEVPFSKRMKAGYSYDITTTEIRKATTGTHELMLAYNFISVTKFPTIKRF
jgi:type IX secretion system PorP/SprF family membrane protein